MVLKLFALQWVVTSQGCGSGQRWRLGMCHFWLRVRASLQGMNISKCGVFKRLLNQRVCVCVCLSRPWSTAT